MDKDIDIVDELRAHEGNAHRDGFVCARCRGADEIERLRDEILKYRVLITEWIDADSAEAAAPPWDHATAFQVRQEAERALRGAVGE